MKSGHWQNSFSLALILALGLSVFCIDIQTADTAPATAITVNHNGDLPDASGGSGVCETAPGNGNCTLRAAIQTAEYTAGTDVITVNDSIIIIGPTSALPALTLGDLTIIGNGVFLSGLNAGSGVSGFEINSNNNKIQGFDIFGFTRGIYIYGGDNNIIGVDGDGAGDAGEGNIIRDNSLGSGIYIMGSNNRISGNYIGTDGSGAAPNRYGIYLGTGTGNLIGTDGDGVSDTLERNVISGNEPYGIEISSESNKVSGNYIGVNPAGSAAIGNDYGIKIVGGAAYNVIGTDSDGNGDASERNVISGNGLFGIFITGAGADHNRVAGNIIGLDQSGSLAIPNSSGVVLGEGAQNNIIGANSDGQAETAERNTISGNLHSGVSLWGAGTHGNRVAGNYIGTSATGLSALGNEYGVSITDGASNNTIGGVAITAPNVISGNTRDGIRLYQSGADNLILGNLIGTDKTGLAAIPNLERGIFINGSGSSSIGGTVSGARNVISGNSGSGISIAYDSSENTVKGNYIGVGQDGVTSLGNGADGISISNSAHHNTIGGVPDALTHSSYGPAQNGGNIIANNAFNGVWDSAGSNNPNPIRGNAIYNNAQLGIFLSDGGNEPILSEVEMVSKYSVLVIGGVLTSTANTDFELDFFVNEQCDPSGAGEGQDYLGSMTLFGPPSGVMPFVMNFPGVYTLGHFVTATATDIAGNSSQFSSCIPISQKTASYYRTNLPLVIKGSVP